MLFAVAERAQTRRDWRAAGQRAGAKAGGDARREIEIEEELPGRMGYKTQRPARRERAECAFELGAIQPNVGRQRAT
jgi:hypothetical protein